MREPFLWIAMICLAGMAVSGFFGFLYYPTITRKHKRKAPPPRQGLARAFFIVFAGGALLGLFFGLLLPG